MAFGAAATQSEVVPTGRHWWQRGTTPVHSAPTRNPRSPVMAVACCKDPPWRGLGFSRHFAWFRVQPPPWPSNPVVRALIASNPRHGRGLSRPW